MILTILSHETQTWDENNKLCFILCFFNQSSRKIISFHAITNPNISSKSSCWHYNVTCPFSSVTTLFMHEELENFDQNWKKKKTKCVEN